MFKKSIAAKRPSKLALIASIGLIAAAASAPSFAASASVASSADVMQPIALTAGTALNFGRFAGTSGGEIDIGLDGGRTVVNGTGVVLSAGGAAASAATFIVKGAADAAFSVNLEGTSIELTGLGVPMGFTVASNLTTGAALIGGGSLDVNGNATLTVGGRLFVNPLQAGGEYTGTVAAVVEYN